MTNGGWEDDNDRKDKRRTPVVESGSKDGSEDLPAPPLPPRPLAFLPKQRQANTNAPRSVSLNLRPQLASKATTAVSLTDIHSQPGQPSTSTEAPSTASPDVLETKSRSKRASQRYDVDDGWSVRSYAPTLEGAGDVKSLLGDILNESGGTRWGSLEDRFEQQKINHGRPVEEEVGLDFENEFADVATSSNDEEAALKQYHLKYKHFLILSTAGKPIYTRHGDKGLISAEIGILQTIISAHDADSSPVRCFTAGASRFVIRTEEPLYLVAISRNLGETESHLRSQLDALYMQILSTLTLPGLKQLFTNRPSTDLQRPLQGTEALLSALADAFTQGSPSTLLSALECLKLRKAQRTVINDILLKSRAPSLLYGLLVAGGRLVSVIRPKRHSLHPSDLQLIFNMLFEAGSVQAGGGENWIPLCLPGFNNKGYLYMYVNFIVDDEAEQLLGEDDTQSPSKEDAMALILISTDKNSFYDLQKMRDSVLAQLAATSNRSGAGSGLEAIRASIRTGRPTSTQLVAGNPIDHFLYRSKANVQFVMPSYLPRYSTMLDRRRLLTVYHHLHGALHNKASNIKIQLTAGPSNVGLAWSSPTFELYAVARPGTTRAAMARGVEGILRWVKREEERLFILGGAVF